MGSGRFIIDIENNNIEFDDIVKEMLEDISTQITAFEDLSLEESFNDLKTTITIKMLKLVDNVMRSISSFIDIVLEFMDNNRERVGKMLTAYGVDRQVSRIEKLFLHSSQAFTTDYLDGVKHAIKAKTKSFDINFESFRVGDIYKILNGNLFVDNFGKSMDDVNKLIRRYVDDHDMRYGSMNNIMDLFGYSANNVFFGLVQQDKDREFDVQDKLRDDMINSKRYFGNMFKSIIDYTGISDIDKLKSSNTWDTTNIVDHLNYISGECTTIINNKIDVPVSVDNYGKLNKSDVKKYLKEYVNFANNFLSDRKGNYYKMDIMYDNIKLWKRRHSIYEKKVRKVLNKATLYKSAIQRVRDVYNNPNQTDDEIRDILTNVYIEISGIINVEFLFLKYLSNTIRSNLYCIYGNYFKTVTNIGASFKKFEDELIIITKK